MSGKIQSPRRLNRSDPHLLRDLILSLRLLGQIFSSFASFVVKKLSRGFSRAE